jgi:putative heme-binding domain-containing protein
MVEFVYLKRDLEEGKRLYLGHCSSCHGADGEGGRGPSLAQNPLPRANSVFKLYRTIGQGIPGTEMPGYWWMTSDRELWLLVAYTRTLSDASAVEVAGDPVRGEALFHGKGRCLECHRVGREGGDMGPDLTAVGSRRGLEYLRQMLLDPDSVSIRTLVPVRVVTSRGERIEGIRVQEDTFSIQLRELSGRFHSFWLDELRSVEELSNRSLMPSYRHVFTDTETADVLRYLVSLRGEQ